MLGIADLGRRRSPSSRSVKDLAHRLSLDAVAEGVEDEAISERMQAMGFDLLQGYHFSRPLSEDDLLSRVSVPAARTGPSPMPPTPVGAPTGLNGARQGPAAGCRWW